MNEIRIVDAHVHFWEPARLHYGWLSGVPQLNRPFLPSDLMTASATVSVEKLIFVEGGGESHQSLAEVDWVCGLAKAEHRLSGIVARAPVEKGKALGDELAALARRPLVRGVRRLLQGESDPEFCLQPDFVTGVSLLANFDWTFDCCVRAEQLPALTELVRRVPQVRFVLDHFGKPGVRERRFEPWATHLNELARLPNISCKISGLTTEADWRNWKAVDLRPYFEIALEAFGYERVLFGGDWPVSTLATTYPRWVDTVIELAGTADEADLQKLFCTNAERIYRV